VDRYGIDEIRRWAFEVWNEPNCGFWDSTKEEYFKLYSYTAKAIKAVDPDIRVGGPATCQAAWITDFIKYVKSNNLPVDFVSTHIYPTDPVPDGNLRNTMKLVFQKAKSESGSLPLYFTEYNDGLYGDPPLHDTIYASAFALFNIIDTYGIVDIMSWWTFTDIFEEGGFVSTPFQGGFGLQTIHGIPKPAFRAFELLHETGYTRYPIKYLNTSIDATAGVLATINHTHVHLLVYNHNVSQGKIKSENLSIRVYGKNIGKPMGLPSIRRIDKNNANAFDTWKRMGSPQYPSLSQIDDLKKDSEMKPMYIPYRVIPNNGIEFQLTIPEQGVASIVFQAFRE